MESSSKKLNVGLAITGSFCTFSRILEEASHLIKEKNWNLIPIFSFSTAKTDTRFGTASDFRKSIVAITGNEPVDSLILAEPLGPKGMLDVIVIAPCTGNTLAKIANAITDTPVTMAVKAHLRNDKPVVIALSSNDLLGLNLQNVGVLLPIKNVYFVPFGQDDIIKKPKSLISDYGQIAQTVEKALEGKQIQPLLLR